MSNLKMEKMEKILLVFSIISLIIKPSTSQYSNTSLQLVQQGQRQAKASGELNLNINSELKWKEIFGDEEKVKYMLQMLKKNKAKDRKTNKRKAIEIILNGTAEEFRTLTYKNVMKFQPILKNLKLSQQKQLILWEILKNRRPVSELRLKDFNYFSENFVLNMPEDDLYQINVLDSEIGSYFGTMQKMTRRKAAILMYSMKNKLSQELQTMDANILNNVKGLLCGFPNYDLTKLTSQYLEQLKPVVFSNLWACHKDQKKILMDAMRGNLLYAKIQMWNATLIENLGFLISVLTPEELQQIEPYLFKKILPNTLKQFTTEQLTTISKEQINELSPESLMVYSSKLIDTTQT